MKYCNFHNENNCGECNFLKAIEPLERIAEFIKSIAGSVEKTAEELKGIRLALERISER